MKKLLTLLIVSFWTTLALAQTTTPNLGMQLPLAAPGTWGEDYNDNFSLLDKSPIVRKTVATLPATPVTNQVVVITDGASGSTCATGGGSSNNTCQWNGTAWVVIGGAGGGGGSGFDEITGGTNTGATMTCGTGCSIVPSGTGAITATDLASGSLSSSDLSTALTDETGSGAAVFGTSPTIVTPTIASLTNAQHNHTNAAGGGQITDAALSAAVTVPKGGTGVATLTNHGVLLGQAAAAIVATGAGTAGQVLTSNGASADPTFQAAGAATAATADWSFTADVSPAQITANQDNYTGCTVASNVVCRLNTDASRNITGITGGTDGRLVMLVNVGSFDIVLVNDATSTAANRFLSSGNITLSANHSVVVLYDATTSRWRVVARSTAVGLTAEADTLDTVFDRGKVIDGATSFANAFKVTDATGDGIAIYRDGTTGPTVDPICGGVQNDCDKVQRLNSGKIFEIRNSSAAAKFTLTESTGALTNVTLNVESTGNTVTTTSYLTIPFASCVAATAGNVWDDDAVGDTAPTAACNDTTNLQRPTSNFSGSARNSLITTFPLPPDWTGNIDLVIRYVSTTAAPTGNVQWDIQTVCRAAGETWDAAFNAAQTITDAVAAQNVLNDATQNTLTVTNCAAGEDMTLKISRNGAADTNNDDAKALWARLLIRRAQ